MSVYLVPEIWCDTCDHRLTWESNVEPDELATWATDTRQAAAADQEWTYDGECDLCPDCQEVEASEPGEATPPPAEERVVDLMAALEASFAQAKAERHQREADRG